MKTTERPIANAVYLLEKFPGKGGWTYAQIPEVKPDKHAHFGWVKVKGTIDGFEIRKYHLMPMGNGKLFLPVRSEIRKKIGKKEGDMVHVILFQDNEPLEIPSELIECLNDEPRAFKFFKSLSEAEQKYYINWIYSAKSEETKVDRMAKSINRLGAGLKFHQTDKVF